MGNDLFAGPSLKRLQGLIEDIRSGKITPQQLQARQRRLDEEVHDVLEEATADEETLEGGLEENESSEEQALGGVVAVSLVELETECNQVAEILDLARKVYENGHEFKFDRLVEVLRSPKYRDEKLIIFTEHRDTLNFLVRQLEGMGFTGQVVQIHGGMDYKQREDAMNAFRMPVSEDGAKYMVATDAAGEGINLQVCWLMVNYDIPWNPARLEQRMGRIHRYGQKHDPVIILNLLAGQTREGRVMATLLEKLERIRKELGSDKVFDVVGRLFEGVSLRAYMEQALSEEGTEEAEQALAGKLTTEQVRAIQDRERRLFGNGGDVKRLLPRLQQDLDHETFRQLLPGYVRNFFERAAPLLGVGFEGDLSDIFSLRPLQPGAFDPFWPALESYPSEKRKHFTFSRPANPDRAIFLHPGEPFFDYFLNYTLSRFEQMALTGGVFVDASASQPSLFHLAEVSVERQANPHIPTLTQNETIETRLVALHEDSSGVLNPCPVESLLLLRGGKSIPPAALGLASSARDRVNVSETYLLTQVMTPLAENRRQILIRDLPDRERFLNHGYEYQQAELAKARTRYTERVNAGDTKAKTELDRIREQQRRLREQRANSLTALRREPELIAPGPITFLTHALVIPSSDPQEVKHRDDRIEQIAMQVALAYEEANGAVVKDVHTPVLARAAGLGDNPGFDLFSCWPDSTEMAIEVKGRAQSGDIDISSNEWSAACNLRERFWLYVVFDCATANPRLVRIVDPWGKIIASARGYVLNLATIMTVAETI